MSEKQLSRHWIGLEELQEGYWEKIEIQNQRGQEFFEKPIEYLEKCDQSASQTYLRREFLTVMGASMAMATLSCARRPVHKIIPYVHKPEEITVGVAQTYSSTCKECQNQCGLVVKTREARPIKLEGNPDHPLNQGALCARGQASLLNLYDPDRLKMPIIDKKTHAQEVNLEQFDTWLGAKLTPQSRIRILSSPLTGPSQRSIVNEFLSSFSNARLIEFDALEDSVALDVQRQCFGKAVLPVLDFESAKVVVSLSADFLGTWGHPVAQAMQWSKKRKLEKNPLFSTLICFESGFSLTGAAADERVKICPNDEVKIALALLYELGVVQKKIKIEDRLMSMLEPYSAQKVASGLGCPSAIIVKAALLLWQNRGACLVIAGGPELQSSSAVVLHVVVNYINVLLGNEGKTIDGTKKAQEVALEQRGFEAVYGLVSELLSHQVDVLLIHDVNLVYLFGDALQAALALKNVATVVSITDGMDETAKVSDAVMPRSHYLEAWSDTAHASGALTIVQPTIRPLYQSRSLEEMLFAVLKKKKTSTRVEKVAGYFEYLQSVWNEQVYQNAKPIGTFDQFWESVLRKGVYQKPLLQNVQARIFNVKALERVLSYRPFMETGLLLQSYYTTALAEGKSANNPWLQELPHPLSSVSWDNYVSISPTTAQKLQLENNDVVEIQGLHKVFELPIVIQPGLHDQVVSIALGYGRKECGKVGKNVGVNIFDIAQVEEKRFVTSGLRVTLSKTAKIYPLAATQWHTATEKRPFINDITYQEYQKNPAFVIETNPELKLEKEESLWSTHEYVQPRWGMAIDLTACTGCQACVIACQAENNVPVVGREQVRKSRQMHWIRIDRYYSGSPSSPELLFQPMMCQHCENAPCETVCPVLATVHDKEGLNVQVYNRCVGTRYCQNNCPYKVRRFNFFDHWKSYEAPMQMLWNPEVTVRSRGIMEKCTFCIQRIQEAKDKAKDAHDRVRDGMLMSACQQTCPTHAIVLGDMNDPQSRVAQLKKSPRVFHALEVLNTKPVVSYMTKVRNKQEA